MDRCYVSDEDRSRFLGRTPADIQKLALQTQQDNEAQIATLEARILALREHTLAMKQVYNSVASIHVKLPVEVLVVIFRIAGPWFNSRAAIQLTHVCHLWRTIIHDTPAYWVDFLDPHRRSRPFGQNIKHSSIVIDALSRSAPMQLNLSIDCNFIPIISAPVAEGHTARIVKLCLDCMPHNNIRKIIRPFFDFRLPTLEELDLQIHCREAILPILSDSSFPALFPRLRTLQTSCVHFATLIAGPSLQALIIHPTYGEESCFGDLRQAYCCPLRSPYDLCTILEKTPHLKKLDLAGCLPLPSDSPLPSPSSLPLFDLEYVKLLDVEDCVRSLLEWFPLHNDMFVFVGTDLPYGSLSQFLSVTRIPPSFSSVDHVELDLRSSSVVPMLLTMVGHAHNEDGRASPRLGVTLIDGHTSWCNLDLLRLFEGFALLVSPSQIVHLKVNYSQNLERGYSAAWVWLLRHFTSLTDLNLVAPMSGTELFSALGQENVAEKLSRLWVTLDGVQVDDWVGEHEAAVSALEWRASRGLRLDSFIYRQRVEGTLSKPPLLELYEERLQAVVVVRTSCSIDWV